MNKLYICKSCNSVVCTNVNIEKLTSSVEITDDIKSNINQNEIMLFCFYKDQLALIKNKPKNFQILISDDNLIKCKTCLENIGSVTYLERAENLMLSIGKFVMDKVLEKKISTFKGTFNREVIGIQEMEIKAELKEHDKLFKEMKNYSEHDIVNINRILTVNNAKEKSEIKKLEDK